MINYTERLTLLMQDIVARTPRCRSSICRDVLVFARSGRSDAEGAFATCHCLTLPPSEPGYYFWRDRATGRAHPPLGVVRHQVADGRDRRHAAIKYMISFALPRFCDQSLDRIAQGDVLSRRRAVGRRSSTRSIHELYHIDPERAGIRRIERADGTYSANCHGPQFFEQVAEMVHGYLATEPDPARLRLPARRLRRAHARYGGVVARRSGISRRSRSATSKPVDMLPADPT